MTFSIFAFEMCNAKSIHTDMSRILLTILCMWLPLQLMAQGFTVRGRVVDKLSRQPVAYANVSLYGNPGQGASTDSLGQFCIEHVAPGIYLDLQNVTKSVLRQQDVLMSTGVVENPEAPASEQRYVMKRLKQESGTLLPTIGLTVEF
ncbi:carboxypeptidase regulatory-like domain-containing protein [Caecibacteroides pullorum]|uniref:Carboxypeptidase regulatory-like domain-containing protein n=1 Tax=Caecibacteroides pullorum TaxID=2725562 RepID=A0AA41D9Q5_9BACT|nr:carboxypeptidase regulatory-like domain-containing protein [Caecibacteroides pullorum]MBV8058824.1 carboxypeptidase-like regulatory domain-containing protein [Caecibacteroides pullorum]